MFYPIGGCETQPLITLANFKLENIYQYGTILTPGVIRCNETNPCHGFEFNNVQADGWWKSLGLGYITDNIYGTVAMSDPEPAFLEEGAELTNFQA